MDLSIIIFSIIFILFAFISSYFNDRPLPIFILKQKRNIHYLFNPGDLVALGSFLLTQKLPQIPKNLDSDWTWCYEKLLFTSRSFSAVILELHKELRDAIALFYLVLRALDTVGRIKCFCKLNFVILEDDMKPSIDTKKKILIEFYTHLEEPGWNLKGCMFFVMNQ